MDKELKIKISIDKETGALNVVKNEFEELTPAIKKATQDTDNFTTRLRDMAHAGALMYVVHEAFDKTTQSVKALVDTSSQFERYSSILKTLEGDSKKASDSLKWINNFASTTPYELAQVTESFVKLKSYGIEPTKGALRTLGDASSAMGKDINQAVEAMADAVMGENERLKEFGIKSAVQGEKIAYTWIDASGKSKNIIIENNAQTIQSTLEAIFNSKYAGAMEEQSKTFAGMVSNMNDNWTRFKYELMSDGAYEYVKLTTKAVSSELDNYYKKSLADTDTFTKFFIESTNTLILYTGRFGNALQGVAIFGKTAFNVLSATWNALVVSIVGGASDLIDVLNKFGANIDNSWSKSVTANAVLSFKDDMDAINDVFDGLVDYEEHSKNIINEMQKSYQNLGKTITDVKIKQDVVGANDGAFKGVKKDNEEKDNKAVKLREEERYTQSVLNVYEELYKKQGDLTKAWAIREGEIRKEYAPFLAKDDLESYVKLAHDEYFDKIVKENEKSVAVMNDTFRDELFKNIEKSMDEQFFDAMTGKFKNATDFIEDMFNSLWESVARGFARTLSGDIVSGAKNFLLPTALAVPTFASSDEATKWLSDTNNTSAFSNEAVQQAKALASSGDVSGVGNLLSNASSLKTGYSLLSGGVNSVIYAPASMMGNLASTMYNAGFTSTGGFLAGSANVLGGGNVSGLSGSAYAGGVATGVLGGGVLGYGLGSLGDKLFWS